MEKEPIETTDDTRKEQEPNLVNRTLLIFKPDAVANQNILQEIIDSAEKAGIKIDHLKEFFFNEEIISKLWPDIYSKDWIKKTVDYLTSGVSIAGITNTYPLCIIASAIKSLITKFEFNDYRCR